MNKKLNTFEQTKTDKENIPCKVTNIKTSRFPSADVVSMLRKKYPKGTRLFLISMDDPYTDLVCGDRGTVVCIDDGGTIHTSWDNGEGLGLVYGVDLYRKLTPEELAQEKVQAVEKANRNKGTER